MKALSIKQPWAFLIASGHKDIENRSKGTSHRGVIAIHASLTLNRGFRIPVREGAVALDEVGGLGNLWEPRYAVDGLAPTPSPLLACGAIIAVAEIGHDHNSHDGQDGCWDRPRCYDREHGVCSPWAVPGQHHWPITNVRPLPKPVVARGSLGLWKVPPDIEAAVHHQLKTSEPEP
ncbi:ASCH domain-containing protein [Nonomuraea typhae]|uniref:ASCH domain-containing protein n=1 Tax=Nonomuraea typhae TaxID=2603600 RepID=UPI0012FB5990|nr:ASCH domain-containing protein [Nonomuraea typhae]